MFDIASALRASFDVRREARAHQAWRAVRAADRPTEMAIAFSAQALYDELPKPLRQSLGNVPAMVEQLERQARAMREHMAALDERIALARAGARFGAGW